MFEIVKEWKQETWKWKCELKKFGIACFVEGKFVWPRSNMLYPLNNNPIGLKIQE